MERGSKQMKRRPEKSAPYSNIRFPVGSQVVLNRPHLWAGARGCVIGESNGIHEVKITARDNETYPKGFSTSASGDVLEVDL